MAEREGFEPPVRFSEKICEMAANKQNSEPQRTSGEKRGFVQVSKSMRALAVPFCRGGAEFPAHLLSLAN
jgi:hypothetical protein